LIKRIWRKVEDKGLQKGGQPEGLEGVCKEVVAEVWTETSGDANKLQIGEKGQTCADEVRWYERGERAKERPKLEEWEQMVARPGRGETATQPQSIMGRGGGGKDSKSGATVQRMGKSME
jgi:hypothetical protein